MKSELELEDEESPGRPKFSTLSTWTETVAVVEEEEDVVVASAVTEGASSVGVSVDVSSASEAEAEADVDGVHSAGRSDSVSFFCIILKQEARVSRSFI